MNYDTLTFDELCTFLEFDSNPLVQMLVRRAREEIDTTETDALLAAEDARETTDEALTCARVEIAQLEAQADVHRAELEATRGALKQLAKSEAKLLRVNPARTAAGARE